MNQKPMTLASRFESDFEVPDQAAGNWIRNSLLAVLDKANCGHLTLKERGRIIGEFGCTNDPLKAEIDILDPRCYRKALLGGNAAAGEAYVAGWWTTPDITAVTRFFSRNLEMMDAWSARFGWLLQPLAWLRSLRRTNSRSQARRNILSHYDLGNDLYAMFLDGNMQYSSGLYQNHSDTLETAQVNKMHRLCEKLQLGPQDHLLEIGTGWGGLALFAAREYGARVTTTTISDEQYSYASRQVALAGLQDRVTVLNRDYRDLEGQYDKLVSVEMIEAVGRRFLPGYFSMIDRLLKPGGLAMIQAITIADQRFGHYSRTEDFIQKHIFPGGFLPSIQLMSDLMARRTSLIVRDLKDIGIDYARTLNDWRQRFNANREKLESLGYDEEFRRLWEYYLGYCEGGFLERRISTVQLLTSKTVTRSG